MNQDKEDADRLVRSVEQSLQKQGVEIVVSGAPIVSGESLAMTLEDIYTRLRVLDKQLDTIYQVYPGFFPKPVLSMSISEKVKFTSNWVKLHRDIAKGRA